jgi:predicted MFS family arabinose efflux permease
MISIFRLDIVPALVPISIPNPYRGLRGLPADVWIIFATTLVNRAGMMALPFLVLYLTKYLGVSASVAGLAISAYGVGGIVTAPIAGRLADRIGPFAVMRGSLALTGVVLLVIPLVHSFALVLLLTFVWAVVADAARPATMSALTGATSPEKRRAAVALHRLAINLGMSIGPAVGGFLALVSFPLLFVVDGLTSLAAAVVLTTLLWIRHRPDPATAERAAAGESSARARAFTRSSVVWRNRAALLFFTTSFLMNIVFAQHQGAMPLYLVRDLHYRESFYGGLFVLNTLLIVAVEVPLNIAMSHWPTRAAIVLSTALIAVGFGGLAIATTTLPIAITVVIWTFGEMIFFPTGTAYVAELAPPGRMGEYMGAFASTFSLSLIVGPWAGAALLDKVGGPITWTVMLVCGLSAAALMGFSRDRGPSILRKNQLTGRRRDSILLKNQ